jgi:hypothetical protein
MKLENLLETKEYKIFVDLDGVMADLHSHVEELLGKKLVTLPNGNWENDHDIWQEVSEKGGVQFDQLELLDDAMELWNYVKQYNPSVLTATGVPREKNTKQKRAWVEKHLSGYADIHTPQTSPEKAKLAKPNHILIDDRTKSTIPWEKAGGIAIQHTDAASTIAKLKELGL